MNLPISTSLLGFVFCAKTNPTRVHLFMNGISDILLKEVLYGVLCFVSEHISLTLKSFVDDLPYHAGVKPVRQYCSTAAVLR